METMNNLLSQLKVARDNFKTHNDAMNNALEEFKKSDDVYTYQRDMRDGIVQLVEELETAVRETALAEYTATANKKPHEKVQIKIFEIFKVIDSNKVLAWVKTNLADALIYDDKKVKNYAMKIGAVEGTEKGTEARVQIASEL